MERLKIIAQPGQTKFTVPTDTKVTIVLCSEIVTATWSRGGAYAGQSAPFQITTAFVGQGAPIVVEGESETGVSLGKIAGEIFSTIFAVNSRCHETSKGATEFDSPWSCPVMSFGSRANPSLCFR
jgi:hypothetical protein